jgi:hypothetical protein
MSRVLLALLGRVVPAAQARRSRNSPAVRIPGAYRTWMSNRDGIAVL